NVYVRTISLKLRNLAGYFNGLGNRPNIKRAVDFHRIVSRNLDVLHLISFKTLRLDAHVVSVWNQMRNSVVATIVGGGGVGRVLGNGSYRDLRPYHGGALRIRHGAKHATKHRLSGRTGN